MLLPAKKLQRRPSFFFRAKRGRLPTSFRPLGDRVLVRPTVGEAKTKAGVIIPDTARPKPQEGEVVAVGPGVRDGGGARPLDVAVGDRILFAKGAGAEVEIGGESLLILRESEIFGVWAPQTPRLRAA